MSEGKSDYIEIKLPKFSGNFLKGLRNNVWIVLTFVLAILLILSFAFNFSNIMAQEDNEVSNSVPATQAGENIVNFLDSKVENGTVRLNGVSERAGLYVVTISYSGQSFDVYSTKDGNYFIQNIVPVN